MHHLMVVYTHARLQREEYWYWQLCTVYPYGLNDNVKGVGNVSSRTDDGLVVYELFNKQKGSLGTAQHIEREGKWIVG